MQTVVFQLEYNNIVGDTIEKVQGMGLDPSA